MPEGGYYDAVIVGGGFAGCMMLEDMRKRGYKARLVESGPVLAGVWYWNCYPGARVDSAAPIYGFNDERLLKEWKWSEEFPAWPEIQRYFKYADEVMNFSKDTDFNTFIKSAVWDDTQHTWNLDATNGAHYTAKYFIPCLGFASKLFVPPLKGLDTFKGRWQHTSRWDPQIPLEGRKVAVVGTGSTGVQAIQEAGKVAKSLYVLQRTPIMALPMRLKKLNDENQEGFLSQYRKKRSLQDCMKDRLNTFSGMLVDFVDKETLAVSPEEREAFYEELYEQGGLNFWLGNYRDYLFNENANKEAYKFWRKKTLPRIPDPQKAALLAPENPQYPIGTKRLSLEQDYYEVLSQDNVSVVDVKANPISEIVPDGVILSDGTFLDVDLLIFATGFDAVTGGLTQIDIRGAQNRLLRDYWSDGLKSELGVCVSGFPNMFYIGGPQSPVAFVNGPSLFEVQVDWVGRLIDKLRHDKVVKADAKTSAEEEFSQHVDSLLVGSLFPKANSWYMGANIPGKKRQVLSYLGGIPQYMDLCETELINGLKSFELTLEPENKEKLSPEVAQVSQPVEMT